jgi:hypothetical protein
MHIRFFFQYCKYQQPKKLGCAIDRYEMFTEAIHQIVDAQTIGDKK